MPQKSFCIHHLAGEELWLLAEKAIYWKNKKTLLIADLHFGKATHFRQRGVNVPSAVVEKNLEVLDSLLKKYKTDRIIVLGDLFHAAENIEWKIFGEWLMTKNIKLHLIKGNHDKLPFDAYEKYNIIVHDNSLLEQPFILRHHPIEDEIFPEYYILAGHVHPSVTIKGKGYQSDRAECFWFGKHQAVLPAFGSFTGNSEICKKRGDEVFAIAGNSVIQIRA
jgi:uncharacterized protein